MMRTLLTLAAACALTPLAQANCYTVHDADGKVLYESRVSPVDASRPYSETLPQRFGPGAMMVVNPDDSTCTGPAPGEVIGGPSVLGAVPQALFTRNRAGQNDSAIPLGANRVRGAATAP